MKRVSRLIVPIENLKIVHPLSCSLVQYTIKDGKKNLAVRLINSSLDSLMKNLNLDYAEGQEVLDLILNRILVKVGFFKRRMGSRKYQVPYMLTEESYLKNSIKRLYKTVIKNKKRDFVSALVSELTAIYRNESTSYTLGEKLRLYKEARTNRVLGYMIANFKLKNPENLKIDLNKIAE